jgi:hypothetical protein
VSWQLRSAMALARIHARRGENAQALRLLTPIYSRFTEGFETRDLRAARQLLRGIEQMQGAITSAFVDHGSAGDARAVPGATPPEDPKTQTSSSSR